jgi:xanthine dehydrogenase YagS FAD-binding subunit
MPLLRWKDRKASGRCRLLISTVYQARHPNGTANLEPGELITAVVLPPSPFAKSGVYLKLRDRASYAFALVSVAAAVDLAGDRIKDARLAMGGVAHKPWRPTEAEKFLIGKPANAETFQQAGRHCPTGSQATAHNGFKVELAKRAIKRSLAVSAKGGGVA